MGILNSVKIFIYLFIYFIGHSLGAHIAGAAGRHFTSLTNQLIPRITGMDSMLTHRTHIFMRYLYSNLIIIIICYLFQALILLGKCVRARM